MKPAVSETTVWSPAANSGMLPRQSLKRLRPHVRAKKPQPRRQGKHDEVILRYIHDYRILSQQQIERLINRSSSTTQHILRRLYDRHWLNRVILPGMLPSGSRVLYILDREGMAYLRQTPVKAITGVPSTRASALFLEHSLALNDFRIMVTQACARQGWQLDTWHSENEIKADYDRVMLEKRSVALVPDGYFTISVPGRGKSHFFLELDRGTMTLRRFREKVQAYVAYYRSGSYYKRYGTQGFRMLTVVDGSGDRRVANLAEMSTQIPGIGRRFWFASLAALSTQAVLHDPAWRIAGQPDNRSLFESTSQT